MVTNEPRSGGTRTTGIAGSALLALGWLLLFVTLTLVSGASVEERGGVLRVLAIASFGALTGGAVLQGLGLVGEVRRLGPFSGYGGMVAFVFAAAAGMMALTVLAPGRSGTLGDLGLRLLPFGAVVLSVSVGLIPLLAPEPVASVHARRWALLGSALLTALLWLVVTVLVLSRGPLGLVGVVPLIMVGCAAAVTTNVGAVFLLGADPPPGRDAADGSPRTGP